MAGKLQGCRYRRSAPAPRRSPYTTLMTDSRSWQGWARISGEDESTSRGTFNGLFPFNIESAAPGQCVLRLNTMLVTLEVDSEGEMCWYACWLSRLIRFIPLCVFHTCTAARWVMPELQQQLVPGLAGPRPAPSSRCC